MNVGIVVQAVLAHVPETDQEPEEQVARSVPANPMLHSSVQVSPLTAPELQLPASPLVTVGRSVQIGPAKLAQTPITLQAP